MSYFNPIHSTAYTPTTYSSLGHTVPNTSSASPTGRRVPQSYTNASLSRLTYNRQPITFDRVKPSMQGVLMSDILSRSSSIDTCMACADDQVFAGSGFERINLRITWPGLELHNWLRSIPVSDSITRAQLARIIAEHFSRFIEKAQYEHFAVNSWRLGRNDGIRIDDLILISLYNISEHTFQAKIAVNS
ncbi:hypothetical protein K435DRAFT_857677 [Dendrothele bispora CBS 962.96]|uniref:Uncharacterized protein n=1 Tax=Dendrothele bispora (strain CBS 962.96) TaxID=1314807 RepID=A0A4V4HG42_DENBC|nr:hypothetical protein K435DRAFT_857677 [Dendrothele bispora CBS 962.96]